jgi:predicted membrane protein
MERIAMDAFFWWGKMAVVTVISLFFFLLGIDSLISSYRSTSPHVFVMGFFSSNLMIMISAVGIIYPAVNIYRRYRPSVHEDNDDAQ